MVTFSTEQQQQISDLFDKSKSVIKYIQEDYPAFVNARKLKKNTEEMDDQLQKAYTIFKKYNCSINNNNVVE